MTYRQFLIKYGEIAIKGKNRRQFEEALMKQIRHALAPLEGDFSVSWEQGRIYVLAPEEYDYEEAVEALTSVFGIVGVCPMLQVQDQGFETLSADVIRFLEEVCPAHDQSFKVFARRARKDYPMDSQTINMTLGERILDHFPQMHVDVHHPEIELHVEIRQMINIYAETIPGPGGMPVGTNGSAMLLLSGGIDSPVAGYMIAKRGVSIDAVYFHAPPYTSERAKQKVVDLARIISRYCGPIRLHIVNFTDIQMYIYEKCPHDELTILMRRYMMRIAEHFAKENGNLGLITGESIGQVASQTMQSLAATNDVCTLPVYRPLIGFDKSEIVKVSEQIDTYETSILPYEDCCTIFVAKHPVTRPKLDVIRKSETRLAERIDELYQTAIDTVEVIKIRG